VTQGGVEAGAIGGSNCLGKEQRIGEREGGIDRIARGTAVAAREAEGGRKGGSQSVEIGASSAAYGGGSGAESEFIESRMVCRGRKQECSRSGRP